MLRVQSESTYHLINSAKYRSIVSPWSKYKIPLGKTKFARNTGAGRRCESGAGRRRRAAHGGRRWQRSGRRGSVRAAARRIDSAVPSVGVRRAPRCAERRAAGERASPLPAARAPHHPLPSNLEPRDD